MTLQQKNKIKDHSKLAPPRYLPINQTQLAESDKH